MLFVQLIGGLGNQMFQYAEGRRLAFVQKEELVLDISAFQEYKLRRYSLYPFRLHARIATKEETYYLKLSLLEKIMNKLGLKRDKPVSQKKFSLFGKCHTIIKRDAYGHWNNAQSLQNIEHLIREDFSLKDPQGEEYDALTKKIGACNSISLHVRRTDYLAVKNSSVFAACPVEYYQKAIKMIAEKTGTMHLFIFSDDIEWVKKNISLVYPTTFVSGGPFADYQELMLMSACKHNITANSTFSWWGAWLNKNPKKIIITPTKWFIDEKMNNEDIILKTWVKM